MVGRGRTRVMEETGDTIKVWSAEEWKKELDKREGKVEVAEKKVEKKIELPDQEEVKIVSKGEKATEKFGAKKPAKRKAQSVYQSFRSVSANTPVKKNNLSVKNYMDTEENKGVPETPPAPPADTKVVETKGTDGDDKIKNFAELRKKNEIIEKENEELRKRLAAVGDTGERSLEAKDEDDEKESKPKKVDETLKVIFSRDLKEATREWNRGKTVPAEEWNQIKSKVKLTGDETKSEIMDKIDEAYQSLPTVRAKREKALIEKGRKLAMGEFQDEELDMGGGGDIDFGGMVEPSFTTKEKSFMDSMGLSPEERKKINKTSTTKDWETGPAPTRKFFQP